MLQQYKDSLGEMRKMIEQEWTVLCMENRFQTNELKLGGVFLTKTVSSGG